MTGEASRRLRRLLGVAGLAVASVGLLGPGPAVVRLGPAVAADERLSVSTDGGTGGAIEGRVTTEDGRAVPAVDVEVVTSLPRGGRGDAVGSAVTDDDGRFRVPAGDGCHLVEITASAGDQFVGADRHIRRRVCVDGGRPSRSVIAVLRTRVATVSGTVATGTSGPAGHAAVDLYRAGPDAGAGVPGPGGTGHTAGFVTSTRTDDDGGYALPVPRHGCYRVVVTGNREGAADHTIVAAGFCVDAPTRRVELDITADVGEVAQIGGRLVYEDGTGAPGMAVELFAATGDGDRGTHLATATTGLGGRYGFDVAASCYVVVLSAPPESWFVGGRASARHRVCVDRGELRTDLDRTLRGTSHAATALTPVEIELARLTNGLRADPSGPLARRRPLPACVDEPFYRITVDPVTGHPEPVEALVLDETVSVEMARGWAARLENTAFEHRPPASQRAFYRELGLPIAAWGENIAWLDGYEEGEVARTHFEGWRESDTGHYCAMVTGRFTNIGIGEHRRGDRSWAVQNFYRLVNPP
ncbi:MAG: hypothetical protein ACFCVK_15705 [Acidimicrobiales bacterium]